jgi:hypothetical protein
MILSLPRKPQSYKTVFFDSNYQDVRKAAVSRPATRKTVRPGTAKLVPDRTSLRLRR